MSGILFYVDNHVFVNTKHFAHSIIWCSHKPDTIEVATLPNLFKYFVLIIQIKLFFFNQNSVVTENSNRTTVSVRKWFLLSEMMKRWWVGYLRKIHKIFMSTVNAAVSVVLNGKSFLLCSTRIAEMCIRDRNHLS